ncbi:MAG: TetR/AcrR family transcriptional regulator [Actinobacteria bacterium]|nr:TetR/AcrR family transcriptional regulator [Actinomycetota bacterium]MBO0834592.1 TetR/AcrR family transcriptional regulator [Actinomycetota bacterium]
MADPVKAATPSDGRRDRWSAHRQQRRAEFVQAALRVLASSGPDLPMDAVAAEAGVTKPVLYRYFADKAALVDALADAGSAVLLARLLPAMQSSHLPLERIREAVGAYFAVIDEQPNLYWLLARWPPAEPGGEAVPAGSTAHPGSMVQQDRELIATSLTAILGDYLRVFGLDSGGAEPWAYGITGLVQSTGEWWLRRRSMSRVHVVDYVTQLIWAALSGVLRDAGIVLDPARPLPPVRPKLTAHATSGTAGESGGRADERTG